MKYREQQGQKGCVIPCSSHRSPGEDTGARGRHSPLSSPSESHLRPEVHLLGGIVLQSRLQHPLRLQPLDVLHVPLTHQSRSCGGQRDKQWVTCDQKKKSNLYRESQGQFGGKWVLRFKEELLTWGLRVTGVGVMRTQNNIQQSVLVHIALGEASGFHHLEGSISPKGNAPLIKGDRERQRL